MTDQNFDAERGVSSELVISLLNYCDPRATAKCIQSLHDACNDIPHRFIVADHSPQAQIELIKAGLGLEVVNLSVFRHSPGNPGFGAGHNRNFGSYTWRGQDLFLILNNDVEFRGSELIREMISRCGPKTLVGCVIETASSGDIWFAGGRINRITGDIKIEKSRPKDDATESDILCGCCIMTRAQGFADLNGFDEAFFMYAEDIDLAIRAAQKGYRLVVVNKTLAHRVGSGYAGRYSSLYLYENTKNRLICLMRHRLGLPLIRESYFVFKYLLLRLMQLFLFSQAPVEQSKAVVRAFVDGLKRRKTA